MDANLKILPIEKSLNGHPRWEYIIGDHFSPSRNILGSLIIAFKSDKSFLEAITHLVLEVSSERVICRSLTGKANLEHVDKNAISILGKNQKDYISLVNDKFLSYVPFERFCNPSKNISLIFCLNGNVIKYISWSNSKEIFDEVHNNVCGHASYTNLKISFQRNGFWNIEVEANLQDFMKNFHACR